ncbi:ferritin-like domain-containing protein [Patescibacteria group bacterium]|nr:ferritin-like domain-containing protein [Patescibacteria group bacterium]
MAVSKKDLLEMGLQKMYFIENTITEELPKMMKESHEDKLIRALGYHLEQTKNQTTRLESIFQSLGLNTKKQKDPTFLSLVSEGGGGLKKIDDAYLKDMAVIEAALKVEHSEMAMYQGLINWCKLLGAEEEAKILEQSLGEEMVTADGLTMLAGTLMRSVVSEV